MDNVNKPLVSIVIPVYNGADYMREAIDSALAQTYENTEILVVNDGSTDNGATREVALSYGDKIRYFEKENGGVSSALNLGIREMRGKYFSWLSHDDAYRPEKVANQVPLLEGRTHCVAKDASITIGADSRVLSRTLHRATDLKDESSWKDAVKVMLKGDSFGGCSFLIPRTAFDECGLFDENLRYVQDQLMWMRLFLHGYDLIYRADEDVLSRVHEKQLTQTGRSLFYAESVQMCRMLLPNLVKADSKEDKLLYYYAKHYARYHVTEVVDMCLRAGKSERLLSHAQVSSIRLTSLYGSIRPLIRRAYYKLFRRMKTN